MDKQETKTSQIKEVDFGDAITPFVDAYPEPTGKIIARDIVLSGFGDLTFIASPNIGGVDTTKFFKDPRRIWTELTLSNQTPEDQVKKIASHLSVRVNVRIKNTITTLTMDGRAEGTKIIFDRVKTGASENPLIEDRNHLKEMTFEFDELVGDQPE